MSIFCYFAYLYSQGSDGRSNWTNGHANANALSWLRGLSADVTLRAMLYSMKKLWVLIPGGTRNNTINWTVKFSAVARDLDSTLQSHIFPTPTCTHLLMTPQDSSRISSTVYQSHIPCY
jgi:hypothetical protein